MPGKSGNPLGQKASYTTPELRYVIYLEPFRWIRRRIKAPFPIPKNHRPMSLGPLGNPNKFRSKVGLSPSIPPLFHARESVDANDVLKVTLPERIFDYSLSVEIVLCLLHVHILPKIDHELAEALRMYVHSSLVRRSLHPRGVLANLYC